MLLKTSLGLVILACLCFPQLAKAQGNLVVNGGFDTNAADWTLTGSAIYNGYGGDPAGSVALVNSGASASQTINGLTTGATYIVSGDYQGVLGLSDPYPTFQVTMNSAILFETAASGNYNWYSFSFLYTAALSSAVLSLDLVEPNPVENVKTSYDIDNIAMQSVPEPSASALIMLGGSVSYTYARKRKCLCF
jgi:hypothetical protein